MKRAAVFLDRDGTIIEDQHYPKDPDKVALIPGAIEALLLMQKKRYVLVVVSNQSGVNRGLISDDEFFAVHKKVCGLLQEEGVNIAEFAYCFHTPEEHCFCRKPFTGNIPKTIGTYSIDFPSSFVVGDRSSDLGLATNLKARGCLVMTGAGGSTYKEVENSAQKDQYAVYTDLLAFAKSLPEAGYTHGGQHS